jgi:chromosome segregation ATPase
MDLDLACSAGKPTMAVIGTIVGTAMVMYHERKNASGHAQGLNEELEQERSQRHNAERQVQGLQQQEQALSRNITQLQQQLNSQRSIGLAADAMYSDAKTKLENSQRELEKKRTEIKRSQLFAQGCANQLRIAQQDRLKLEKALVLPGTTLRLTVAQLGELMPELSTLHKIAASVETDTNGLKFEDFRDALTMLGASYLDYRQQIEQHPVEIKKINDSHNDERKVLNDQLIKAGASSGHYLQFLTEFANKCDDLDQLSQLMPEDFLNRIDEFMEFTQMRSQKPGVGPVINRAMINLGKILEYLKSSFEDQVRDRDGQIDSLKDKHSKETAALKKKHTEVSHHIPFPF